MSDREDDDELVIRGSGDFLADQGIEDPAEFRVKCHLCHEIATIAEKRGLAPNDVAMLAGETEQDVERILRSGHDGFEVWRLIKALCALGADVGISVNRDSGHEKGVVLTHTIEPDKETILRELAQMDEIDYQPEPRL
jgi:predicted XRE-type DNA-binding protein